MRYENINDVLEAILTAYYGLRDVDATLACVTDDIEWIGTEESEYAEGREAVEQLLREDIRAFPDSFEVVMDEPVIHKMGENAVLVYMGGKQTAVPGQVAGLTVRGTAGCLKTEDGWRINHLHVSVPNTAIEKYSLEKELDKTRRKEQLLLSGIPGGVAIYRLKKDGSVHTDFTSDGFAKICGFGSGRQMCRYLRHNALKYIVKEDAQAIRTAVMKSLTDHKPINIMYHVRGRKGELFLQRMDANVMDTELAEDELAVWYAVHTVVSDRAKQILAEQKELHALIDDVPTGIGIYEVRDGKILQSYVNDAFYRMLGTSRENRLNYVGEKMIESVHPDDRATIDEATRRALAGEDSYSIDYRLALDDGKWFWVHLVGSVVERRDNYIRIYAAISDYNAIKAREQQYEEQLRLNSAVTVDALSKVYINLSQNKVMAFECEAADYKAHENMQDADVLLASIRDDVWNQHDLEKFACVADCDTIIKEFKKGITHHEIIIHLQDTRWTKAIYDVMENAYTGDIEMISSIHDVTEQVRSELVVNKLLEIEYHSILLIDTKTGYAVPFKRGDEDNNIEELNTGMAQTQSQQAGLVAFFRAHALPDKVDEVIRANSPETIARALEKAPCYECMYTLMENGRRSQYKVTYSYLEEDRRILLSAVQDVTNVYEKEIEQNNRLTQALVQADASNKAKTAFLSRVSHDMRTPLNGILGLTTLLKDSITDQNILRDLGQMESSGKYLLNLINDTLDMSRIESGKLELHPVVVDGKDFFNHAMDLAKVNIESKNIHYHIHVAELPFTILYDDVARLEQVIMNIVSNAVKFTPEGGSIDLTVKNIAFKDGVITDEVIVEDTGIGMSPDFVPHIFEPFSQEDATRTTRSQGTGLGMAITKQLLQRMGGDIKVESRLGQGTRVTITMQLHVATKEQIAAREREQKPDAVGINLAGKRVLLCEDHPLNAQIATRLLAAEGVVVERAENGQVGLTMFEHAEPGYYDAILMDIRMPVMDGLDATRAIRSLPRRDARMIPIAAMTANAFKEDIEQTRNVGMDAHLSKPIDKDLLYRTLATLMKVDHDTRKQKVLVVDDAELNRAVIRAALENDYEVLEAPDGKQALALMEHSSGIDVVITDIQMPEMDGIELIRKLRADPKNRHLVILANTQYGDPAQEETLLNLGANDFVYKPNTPKILEVRVRSALRRV